MGKSFPIRLVGLRDGLMMVGDHAMPAGRRHWRATGSAFALVDPYNRPMVWLEGAADAVKVVGDIEATVAKPTYKGRRSPGLVQPGDTRQLKWFEVLRVGGVAVIRTHWAVGDNIDRTTREAFDEVLPHSKAEQAARLAELTLMMGV